MIEKWKTSSWGIEIEPVTVLRETDQSVFLKGRWNSAKERREAKISDGHQYHDTWEAAHNYLLSREKGKVEDAHSRLRSAQGKYGTLKGMTPPATRQSEQP